MGLGREKYHLDMESVREKSVSELKKITDKLISYGVEKEVIIELIRNHEVSIPVEIFNDKLGSLESIVKFLRDEYLFSYKKIAGLLSRSASTIGIVYRNAKRKHPKKIKYKDGITVPVKALVDRKYSVLESLVSYLYKNGYSFSSIARYLHRDPRTIWTIYRRYSIKNG